MTANLQPALLEALQAQFAVVQCLRRSAIDEWSVVHAATGLDGQAMPLAAEPAALSDALAWIREPHRNQVAFALENVANGLSHWHTEYEHDPAPSTSCWLEIRVSSLPVGPGSSLFLLTARDITREKTSALRHTERQDHWALVSAATGLGVVMYDPSLRILQLDDVAAKHHGLRTFAADGLPLDVWLAYVAEEDRLKAHTLLTSEPLPGQSDAMTVRLVPIDAKQNKVLELAFCCTADGSRLIGSCRDVTEERAIDEMRRKKLVAERASKAKSAFMSQISHELRTPLNGILGFAQVMLLDQDQPLAEEQRKRVDVMLYSGRRLLALIDQLLEISRIEQGKRAINIRSVNVAAAIRRGIEQVQPLADQAAVVIETIVEHPERAAVRADPGALEQILVNLLSNAIKYNRPRGRVRIRFVRDEMASIVVDDTGRGISNSEMGRLFEPFNRLSAQKSSVPGHGLGLAISRQLAEAMGGELRVESKVGLGSSFSLHLPMASVSRFDASTSLQMELPSQWDGAVQHAVLYVEDDPVNTLLMEHLFSTQPTWTLHTAETGSEGIQTALRVQLDVILLDLNLPDMSGLEVFKRLRNDPRTRHIPCVAVSADAMPAHVRRGLADGFDDYWVKPLELTSVITKLKELLV